MKNSQTKFVRTLTRRSRDDYRDSNGALFLCTIAACFYFGASPRKLRLEVSLRSPCGVSWKAASLGGAPPCRTVQVGFDYYATYTAMRRFLRGACGIQPYQTFWFRLRPVP